MARLFILFLIALLPLRGWPMERMVFAMDRAAPVALALAGVESGRSEDCASHRLGAAGEHGDEAAQAPQNNACQHCQLCMPLAGLQVSLSLAVTATPHVLPAPLQSRFASADAARGVKPPIC